MDDERNVNYKLLLLVCSITIVIEITLFIWSSVQVSKLDLHSSNIEAIQLAKKGIMIFFTLLVSTCATTGVSFAIPQIRVWNLYRKAEGHQYFWIASIFFFAYFIIPIASILSSICSGFSFINESGISFFQMISYLL